MHSLDHIVTQQLLLLNAVLGQANLGSLAPAGPVSTHKYLLRAHHEPNPDVGTGHKAVDKTDKCARPHGAYILVCVMGEGRERETVKISKQNVWHAKCQ